MDLFHIEYEIIVHVEAGFGRSVADWHPGQLHGDGAYEADAKDPVMGEAHNGSKTEDGCGGKTTSLGK